MTHIMASLQDRNNTIAYADKVPSTYKGTNADDAA